MRFERASASFDPTWARCSSVDRRAGPITVPSAGSLVYDRLQIEPARQTFSTGRSSHQRPPFECGSNLSVKQRRPLRSARRGIGSRADTCRFVIVRRTSRMHDERGSSLAQTQGLVFVIDTSTAEGGIDVQREPFGSLPRSSWKSMQLNVCPGSPQSRHRGQRSHQLFVRSDQPAFAVRDNNAIAVQRGPP